MGDVSPDGGLCRERADAGGFLRGGGAKGSHVSVLVAALPGGSDSGRGWRLRGAGTAGDDPGGKRHRAALRRGAAAA